MIDTPPAAPPPLLVPAKVAAAMIGVSRAMFYSMAADGRLGPTALHFGRRRLWRVDQLRAWTEQNCPPRAEWMTLKRGDA